MRNIETKKVDYIDAIRGIAILGVVLVHSSQWVAPASTILSKIASEGARGVQLFYLISAFTLFMSFGSRNKSESKPIISFFIRRFFRIAPSFYLAIIIYTLYYGMSARYWAPNGLEWWYIPLTISFLHGLHPETITSVVPGGWSIAVEMIFYLFVPYLFIKLNSIKVTLLALFVSLFFSKLFKIFILYLLSPTYPDSQQYLINNFAFLQFFSQLPIFIMGILLYHIIKKHPKADNTIAMLLLILSIFLFAVFLKSGHFSYGVAFIVFSLSLHYSPQKFLVNQFTIAIGRLSFSIYLVHFMVLEIVKIIFSDGFILEGNSSFVLAFILVLMLSVGVSYFTHMMIEKPGIRLGKEIIKKL